MISNCWFWINERYVGTRNETFPSDHTHCQPSFTWNRSSTIWEKEHMCRIDILKRTILSVRSRGCSSPHPMNSFRSTRIDNEPLIELGTDRCRVPSSWSTFNVCTSLFFLLLWYRSNEYPTFSRWWFSFVSPTWEILFISREIAWLTYLQSSICSLLLPYDSIDVICCFGFVFSVFLFSFW